MVEKIEVSGSQQLQKQFRRIQRISGCDTLGVPAFSLAELLLQH